ncbi:MAG: hypothetical protein WBD55_04075 [Dehalococcoidia bacterium]
MDVAFAMLADAANVSREGKLNILGAFDRIHGSTFPLTWPRMVLVTRFIASAAEYGAEKQIELVTLDADGKRLGIASGKMTLPMGPSGRQMKINHVLPMTLTFPGPGTYSIEILVNGEPKATVPLDVVQREEKQNGQADGEQQAEA